MTEWVAVGFWRPLAGAGWMVWAGGDWTGEFGGLGRMGGWIISGGML